MATQNQDQIFPACELRFPQTIGQRRASFYLAAEEYVAHSLPDDNYLFSWILPPTVVMGRNQVAHVEFDLDYCQAAGIDIVRRKSGGGAVYADGNNIMWSLITGGGDVESLFRNYANTVAKGLSQLGAPTEATGRNDIVLQGGGKVCGNAFYHQHHHNIVHGTMLYDTNMESMQRTLRPSPEKLKTKGVQSVRRRIALLKDFLDGGVKKLQSDLTSILTNRHQYLTEDDVRQIEEIERTYLEPEFLWGHIKDADVCVKRHIDNCGIIELHFTLQGSVVEDVTLLGDFFALSDVQSAFRQAFVGKTYTSSTLQDAAQQFALHQTIRGLTASDLQQLLSDISR